MNAASCAAAVFAVGLASPALAGQPIPFEQVIIDSSQVAYQRVIVDLDGDGANDVVAITNSHIRWYPAPNFNPVDLLQLSVSQHGYPLFRADGLEYADIDNDGDPDLVTRIGDDGVENGNVVWFKNPRPAQPVTSNWPMYVLGANQYTKDIKVADFDNDGKLDVVTREHAATQIWFQNSASSWTKKQISHPSYEGMDVGDMDNDGDPDIVLNGFWLRTPLNPRGGSYASYTIDAMWFSQGEGFPNNCCRVFVVDINNNGKLDVVLCHSERTGFPVAWYSAVNPTGTWQQHIVTPQFDLCHTLHAADFNDDGDLDVLAGGMPNSAQSGLRLYLGNGAGGWSEEVVQTLGAYSAGIGDLQNDGDLDVINVRNWNEAPTEIWKNGLGDDEACLGDIASAATFQPPGDGAVNSADLAYLLSEWGAVAGGPGGSPADLVSNVTFAPPGDGMVDGADLAALLSAWGACDGTGGGGGSGGGGGGGGDQGHAGN